MADQIKDIYRVAAANPSEINKVLQRIADRMDKLEGLRGTPKFATSTIETPDSENFIMKNSYQVGSILMTGSSTNPADTLGYGTWESIGTGAVLAGISDSLYVWKRTA